MVSLSKKTEKTRTAGVVLGVILGILLVIFLTDTEEFDYGTEPKRDRDGVYLVTKKEEFVWVLAKSGTVQIDVRLTKDIYLNDTSDFANWGERAPKYGYESLASFAGTFDGDGHAIVGYFPDDPNMRGYHVLFGNIRPEGCVKNLTIRESYFGSSYEERTATDMDFSRIDVPMASGLCQYNNGTIENCEIDVKVTGDGSAAGIAVWNGGVIRSCKFSGELTAGACLLRKEETLQIDRPLWYVGGIAAINMPWGVIEDCVNYSEVVLYADGQKRWRDTDLLESVQEKTCAGGIVGLNQGKVLRCTNKVQVICDKIAGGIVGVNEGDGYMDACKGMDDIPLIGKNLSDLEDKNQIVIEDSMAQEDRNDGFIGPKRDVRYTVEKGDCLWRIAKKFYGDGSYWEELARVNGIGGAYIIRVGEEIWVPRLYRD